MNVFSSVRIKSATVSLLPYEVCLKSIAARARVWCSNRPRRVSTISSKFAGYLSQGDSTLVVQVPANGQLTE